MVAKPPIHFDAIADISLYGFMLLCVQNRCPLVRSSPRRFPTIECDAYDDFHLRHPSFPWLRSQGYLPAAVKRHRGSDYNGRLSCGVRKPFEDG